jgi:hypothetical protein
MAKEQLIKKQRIANLMLLMARTMKIEEKEMLNLLLVERMKRFQM